MKRLFDRLFKIPEDGKMTEKSLTSHLVASVISIIIFVVALASSTFAFFYESVTSPTNVIRSADFDVNISVKNGDDDLIADSGEYIFEYDTTYRTSITRTENSVATGFCRIEIDFGDETSILLYTNQIGDGISFELESVSSASTVKFTPLWGTQAHTDVYSGDVIKVKLSGSDVTTVMPIKTAKTVCALLVENNVPAGTYTDASLSLLVDTGVCEVKMASGDNVKFKVEDVTGDDVEYIYVECNNGTYSIISDSEY